MSAAVRQRLQFVATWQAGTWSYVLAHPGNVSEHALPGRSMTEQELQEFFTAHDPGVLHNLSHSLANARREASPATK